MKDIKQFKMYMRLKYRTIRENMSKSYKLKMDKKILHNISFLNIFKNAKSVLTYVSKDIEVDTFDLIKKCLSKGKIVAAPVCKTETKQMGFYIINSVDDLEKGAFGLLEPKPDCEELTDTKNSVCIVPGFCFDNNGYRLGYGYGYYDRYLENFEGKTIGICYSNCIVNRLRTGKYDKPVDYLVTDKYIKQTEYNNFAPIRK